MNPKTRLKLKREQAKMARNSEKHFVGLNRIYLEEQWKKDRERKRPHLSTLITVGDVKKWIPSIKREMNYCIEQLSGARKHDYTDGKIKEFEERLAYLEREYKRFVQKVFQLDPKSKDIPWEARPYKRKNKQEPNNSGDGDSKKKKSLQIKICQDLLDDKQQPSDIDEEKQLSPLFQEREKCSVGHGDSKNGSAMSRCSEQEIMDVKGKAVVDHSRRSLVSYDSSDSDGT